MAARGARGGGRRQHGGACGFGPPGSRKMTSCGCGRGGPAAASLLRAVEWPAGAAARPASPRDGPRGRPRPGPAPLRREAVLARVRPAGAAGGPAARPARARGPRRGLALPQLPGTRGRLVLPEPPPWRPGGGRALRRGARCAERCAPHGRPAGPWPASGRSPGPEFLGALPGGGRPSESRPCLVGAQGGGSERPWAPASLRAGPRAGRPGEGEAPRRRRALPSAPPRRKRPCGPGGAPTLPSGTQPPALSPRPLGGEVSGSITPFPSGPAGLGSPALRADCR